MDEFDSNILASACPNGQAVGNRRYFAFANPTGICRLRTAVVGEIAARGWGIILPRTAMTALRTDSFPIASRALATLVDVGEARRVRIEGTNEYAWGTTPLLANQYRYAKPGTRFFPPKTIGVWKPYKEFIHNQLALRVLCGLAAPSEFLTEPELENVVPDKTHVADGVVRLVLDGQTWIFEVQIEKSRKTGTKGGWAELAERIVAVCLDKAFGRWKTPLGTINGVLLVSSIGDARKIVARVRKIIGDAEDVPSVWFLFAEIKNADGQPIRRYSDIHPFSPLGQVRIWHAESDDPYPDALQTIWTPTAKIGQTLC